MNLQGTRDSLPGHHQCHMHYHLQICFQQAVRSQAAMEQLQQENQRLSSTCSKMEDRLGQLEATVARLDCSCSAQGSSRLEPQFASLHVDDKRLTTFERSAPRATMKIYLFW